MNPFNFHHLKKSAGCINGTLDDSTYSSSTHEVGFLVIYASAGCLITLVATDIVYGNFSREELLSRLSWLLNQLKFSLNSTIMLYLSIISVLVQDTTTKMPRVIDQLAKLCGTAIVCISMGVFMVYTVGGNNMENVGNLIGMFFFLIIQFQFINLQIQVGVIALFIAEQIILLVCSFVLVILMLYFALDNRNQKAEAIDISKDVFSSNSQEGMLKRLKLCYMYGFNSNPRFVIRKHPLSAIVGGLCLLCTVVLLQAAFRSLVLKQLRFCDGTSSDYGGTIKPIVIIQILAVIVGCFITTKRWIWFVNHTKIDSIIKKVGKKSEYVDMNQALFPKNDEKFMIRNLQMVRRILQMVILGLGAALSKIVVNPICCKRKYKPDDNTSIREFQELLEKGDMGLDKWTVQIAVDVMERWIQRSKREPLEFMSALLMRNPSSHQQLTMEIRDREYPNRVGIIEASSLSMILLARIAEVSLPTSSDLNLFLLKVFNEAYHIIEFVDFAVNSGNSKNFRKLRFAKSLKRGSDFSCLVQNFHLKPSTSAMVRTVAILEGLKQVFPNDFVKGELCAIIDVVNYQEHSASINDLYNHMERVFADMLCALLAQLPHAISKQLLESPADEYVERVRRALWILFRLQSSFPDRPKLLSWIWITTPDCSMLTKAV